MLMKHTTASGSHSPDIVQEKQRSWQFVCLPTLHFLSLVLRRGFGRTPTNHTMRLTWTFKSLRQSECSGFVKNLPKWHINSTLSEWLVPTLWSLVLKLIAVTSAVYAPSSWITWGSLVDPPLHWVLCRWLAGVFRESLHPYFIRSSFFRSLIFYPLSLLQDHYIITGWGCQVFINKNLHSFVPLPFVQPY